MDRPELKSEYRLKKEKEDLKVYNLFTSLMKNKDASVEGVNREIMRQHPEIKAQSTIWAIRKRVQKLKAEQKRKSK